MGEYMLQWVKAAAIRALKTAAQAAIGAIGASVTIGAVDWRLVASTAALAAIVSVLTSINGLPEVADGASVSRLVKSDKAASESGD